jgi:carbon monoxide dehydrogenase subunit G
MGEIQKQIFFNAPVEKVWGIWTNVEKTPEWVEGVQESRITSGVREGRGLEWTEKCQFGKQVISMDHEIKDWEPLKKTFAKTGLPMGGSMETTAEFKPSPQGTEVLLHVEWDLGMVGAIIGEEKLQHMMQKSFDATTAKWKAKAETPA